jgi:hypothetical protein
VLQRERVAGDWRTLHNEELFQIEYYSGESRGTRWAGHVALIGEEIITHWILLGKKPEEERTPKDVNVYGG